MWQARSISCLLRYVAQNPPRLKLLKRRDFFSQLGAGSRRRCLIEDLLFGCFDFVVGRLIEVVNVIIVERLGLKGKRDVDPSTAAAYRVLAVAFRGARAAVAVTDRSLLVTTPADAGGS